MSNTTDATVAKETKEPEKKKFEITKIDLGIPAAIKFRFTTSMIQAKLQASLGALFAELNSVRVEPFVGRSHICHFDFYLSDVKSKNTLYRACVAGDETSSGKKSYIAAVMNNTAASAAANLIKPHDDLKLFVNEMCKEVVRKDVHHILTVQQVAAQIKYENLHDPRNGSCTGLRMSVPFEIVLDYFLPESYVVAKQETVEEEINEDGTKEYIADIMQLDFSFDNLPAPVVNAAVHGPYVVEEAQYDLERVVAGGTPGAAIYNNIRNF